MPSRIWLPSSLAAPVNGAEIPNRTSLLVTPRMLGALSFAPPTDATRAGTLLGDRGAAVVVETPGATLVPFEILGASPENRVMNSVVFAASPGNFLERPGNWSVINRRIAAPTIAAITARQTFRARHLRVRGVGQGFFKNSGISECCKSRSSRSEIGGSLLSSR